MEHKQNNPKNQELNEQQNSQNNYLLILPYKLNNSGLLETIFLLNDRIVKEKLDFNSSNDKDMLSKTMSFCKEKKIDVEKENYVYLGECFDEDKTEYDIYVVNVQDSNMSISDLKPKKSSMKNVTEQPLLSVVFLRLFEKIYKKSSFERLKQTKD